MSLPKLTLQMLLLDAGLILIVLSVRHQVDTAFGPKTIDLMALPFNAQADRAGRPLRFFAPLPCAQALGINVFAQDISSDENACLSPFCHYWPAPEIPTFPTMHLFHCFPGPLPEKVLVAAGSTKCFKLV